MEVGGFQALWRLGYLSHLTPAGLFTAGRVHQVFMILSLPWLFTYPSPSPHLEPFIFQSATLYVCLFVCFATGS